MLLSKLAVPAEVARGCCFAETFFCPVSVRQNEGSITGSPVYGNGFVTLSGTQAFSYSFLNGFSSVDTTAHFISSNFSIVARVRTTSNTINIVTKGGLTGCDNFKLGVDANGKAFFQHSRNVAVTFATATSTISINDGKWHTIVGMRTGGEASAIYVDGVLDGTGSTSGGGLGLDVGIYPLIIGGIRTSGVDATVIPSFVGDLAFVKVFDGLNLTAAECLAYHENTMFNYMEKAVVNLPMSSARNVSKTYSLNGTDWDMEDSGITNWTAGNSAALTKDSSAPYQGIRDLRVSRSGVDNPYATIAPFVIGRSYTVTVYAKSDGNAQARISNGGSYLVVASTPLTWTPITATFTATSSTFRMYAITATGTQYVDYDLLTIIENATPVTTDASGKGNDFVKGDGATAATIPIKLASRGYTFDGTDYLSGKDASNLRTAAVSVFVNMRVSPSSALYRIAENGAAGAYSTNNWMLSWTNSTNPNTIALDARTPASTIYSSNNSVISSKQNVVGFTCDGTNAYLYSNGVQVGTSAATVGTNNTSGQWIGTDSNLSAKFGGDIYEFVQFPFALNPIQVIDLNLRMRNDTVKSD